MKKLFILSLIVAMIFAVAACGSKESTQNSADSNKPVVLRVGNTTAPDSHYNKGLEEFKKKVKEYTNGSVEVKIYPSSELGDERDLVEGVAMGTVEMALVSTGPLANYSPDFMVFDLPFIVTDRDKAYKVMDGEVGQEILGTLKPKGIKAMGFWENGFRNITNNEKPIVHPEDVKGMKIRTMENPIHIETFKTLGATPTPMAWSEVFTALQQGTIDGQENPLAIIDTAKVYEVQKYVSLTGHFYSPAVLMINDKFFEGLSKSQQDAILKAEKEARDWERNYSEELDNNLVKTLEEKGVTVTPVDKNEWQEVVKPVYDKFKDQINSKYIEALAGN
ncbi:tripartite ATP-independent transporter solute receptor, DctP family [Desulfotomaculum arcticum]|uniref:Tripartite ATP-independent transporter solute receptor, DctP family n=1 Tax=Desulfotruncus arcticus DSM 17038 TaxID=1121424 RepID=A0A1I2P111_9FIRM|nr:TRAP transporter substrate-binding protein [Desulfotruncus arcticus]SFG09832.1 tripartite ATP-independent transporter solute receptor, DctP family [Desulfotomaculum arcticum] [Desulfotruncus arcticus DSM 17038]